MSVSGAAHPVSDPLSMAAAAMLNDVASAALAMRHHEAQALFRSAAIGTPLVGFTNFAFVLPLFSDKLRLSHWLPKPRQQQWSEEPCSQLPALGGNEGAGGGLDLAGLCKLERLL